MFDLRDSECHFGLQWGGGESKVTKGYLSETFACSIYEIASVTFGVQRRGEE